MSRPGGRRVAALVAGLVLAAAVFASAVPASAATPHVARVSGADRYATAVAVSRSLYPSGAGIVWIASGTSFPDALSAGPAAAAQNADLLLTAQNQLPGTIKGELKRLHPSKVVIAGGPSAVSASVAKAIKSATGVQPVRVAGADRYGTSVAISRYAFSKASTAYVASGAAFPDALAASAAAGAQKVPVILVPRTGNISAQKAELTRLGVTATRVAGGASAISSSVSARLPGVTRYAGADRYATAIYLAGTRAAGGIAYVASSTNFPDALVGARASARAGAPLYLSQSGCLTNSTAAQLTKTKVASVTLLGGASALGSRVAALSTCSGGTVSVPTHPPAAHHVVTVNVAASGYERGCARLGPWTSVTVTGGTVLNILQSNVPPAPHRWDYSLIQTDFTSPSATAEIFVCE